VSLIVRAVARHPTQAKTTAKLVGTALCLAAAIALPVAAADKPGSTAAATQTETLVLRVILNTENRGDLFVQRTPDLDFLVKVEDLKAMGFKDIAATVRSIDGEPHISLRSIQGVTARFDEKELALHITAEPRLLAGDSFDLRGGRRRKNITQSSNSAFLNYAFTGTHGSASSDGLGFSGEAGIRLGDYLLMSDASTVDTPSGKKLVRLMSSATLDDRENLRRVVLGDVLTPSRDFSNSVNLGGISIAKSYAIDPYFIRFPTQSLTGSVALPSDMEVYLDGQRIRTERLRPGEFELRDILAYGGARNVQVVLRDAFGRVEQLNYSLYFTDQPLQPGLHEYSYNFGAIRRDFGLRSNKYGPLAFTMYHRYGLNRAVTLGWRAEATRRLLNTGPTATLVVGPLGVVNLGLAMSTIGGRQGAAGLASYTYESKNWSMGLFLRHDGRDYVGLGDPPVMTNRRYEGSASASYRLSGSSTVTLSHAALTTRAGTTATASASPGQPFSFTALANHRVTALSYSTPIPSTRAHLTASLSRIKDTLGPGRTEAFLGLSILLDKEHTAAASYRSDRRDHTESVRLTKYQPVGEGLGYSLSADHSSSVQSTQFRSDAQYNAPAAVIRADYGHYQIQGQKDQDLRLSVAGGIVAVGGHVAVSRPITQSYAIVKVGELKDVGVFVHGQPTAKTDSHGLAVLPNLSAYYENNVSIAAGSLPLDYALPAEIKKVSPAPRSGAFVDFGVTKTQAFTGKLISRLGPVAKPVEVAEMEVSIDGKSQKLIAGRGGEFYIENLKPGIYKGSVSVGSERCVFELAIPKSDETFVDLGEVQCLRPR
jgi:outer membrane usher protein